MSTPIFKIADKLLKFQQNYPAQPIIERAMLHAESRIDFAGAYLALWLREGREASTPADMVLTPFIRDAIAIVHEVMKDMGSYQPKTPEVVIPAEFGTLLKCMDRLVTQAFGRGSGGACFVEWEPSEQAKRQAREQRAKDGVTYHRPSMRRKREVCGVLDQRLPAHW